MNINKHKLLTSLFPVLVYCPPALSDTNNQPVAQQLKEEAQVKTKAFATQLKQTLKSAIEAGGLVQGINVCSSLAGEIAVQHSTNGWTVSRISLKNRNPNNTPTNWQIDILKTFNNQVTIDDKAKDLVYGEIHKTDSHKEYRFVKATPTAPICLNCHGKDINPQVHKHISNLYPQDKAINYNIGEVRGALVLTKRL